MRIILVLRGYEVWGKFDNSAQVWELFASKEGNDYIGCADDLNEAKKIAHEWVNDKNNY